MIIDSANKIKQRPIEDPTLGQALEGDNKSAEDNSCKTILEAPHRLTRGDIPPVEENMWFLGSQKVPKNFGAIGAKDTMEVNASLGNKKSGGEDEIAAEIEQLKKEQKRAQIKIKLHCLREHQAQRFVKDVSEQEFYAQKLALERTKKVCSPNVYLGES